MSGNKPDYTIVIPARYASSRFPGKPLALLNGLELLMHVVNRARQTHASQIIVATDDQRIQALCQRHEVDVEMTSPDHPSGTDRIAEVAERRGWSAEHIVVGLQGDEPATPAGHLQRLADNLVAHPDADMATLCSAALTRADYLNPNRVKVVRDISGMALYFSRAPIPHRRALSLPTSSTESSADDADLSSAETAFPDAMIHIGLYAYRCGFLHRYHAFEPSVLEQEESLEQLRVLHHGGRIHVDNVAALEAHGVDHPDDVPALERVLTTHFAAQSSPLARESPSDQTPEYVQVPGTGPASVAGASAETHTHTVVMVSTRPLLIKTFEKLLGAVASDASLTAFKDVAALHQAPSTAALRSVIVDVGTGGQALIDAAFDDLMDDPATTRLIFVLDAVDNALIDWAMERGAAGVLLKSAPPGVIADGFSRVLAGELCRPAPVVQFDAESVPKAIRQQLTARQQKLLRLLMGGESLTRIAEQLHITPAKAVDQSRRVMQVIRGQEGTGP